MRISDLRLLFFNILGAKSLFLWKGPGEAQYAINTTTHNKDT